MRKASAKATGLAICLGIVASPAALAKTIAFDLSGTKQFARTHREIQLRPAVTITAGPIAMDYLA